MGTVSADKSDTWVIKDMIRKKYIQALDGKTIENPSAFANSTEGKELYESIKSEVEAFVGYTIEAAQEADLTEDLAHEIEYSSRTLGDEKAKDGLAELNADNPEEILK